MHTVWMTCYIDEYPLLCCTIVKFQWPAFHPYNILKFNVPIFDIQTKAPYFYTRFDSYTKHVLMAAVLDMIDRQNAGSLLVITCKWNFFMKHDFVNNILYYIYILIIYLLTSRYLLLLPQLMHTEQHIELLPLVQKVIQSLRQQMNQQYSLCYCYMTPYCCLQMSCLSTHMINPIWYIGFWL